VRDGKKAEAKKMLEDHEPYDLSVAKEILKYINAGSGSDYLKESIDFVQHFDHRLQADAFKEIYKIIKLKDQTADPEMLLLQRKIKGLKGPGSAMDEIKKQVDDDCRMIISRIVKGIVEKDYSISIYVEKELDLLDENMATIVQEFSTGSLENTLLLIQYSIKLPYIENSCFLIDALLKELEKRELLDSMQAMHLWAHAKRTKEEEPNWPFEAASVRKLCTDALEKLSLNKEKFFQYYQEYVGDSDKQKIRDLHLSNLHLKSIVRDFVSFYYNGEVGRTQNLLAAANAITKYLTVGRILSQLHEEMAKSDQLKSFEAFRLFNEVKRFMSFISNFNSLRPDTKKPFEDLKEKAPAWVRQLLWPGGRLRFIITNKFTKNHLIASEDKVFKWTNGAECGWRVSVDPETSLLSFSLSSGLKLGLENKEAIVSALGSQFMISADDGLHITLHNNKGNLNL
jgi:hypothetical protein